MASNDLVLVIDQERDVESKRLDALSDLADLLVGMNSGIAGIGLQSCRREVSNLQLRSQQVHLFPSAHNEQSHCDRRLATDQMNLVSSQFEVLISGAGSVLVPKLSNQNFVAVSYHSTLRLIESSGLVIRMAFVAMYSNACDAWPKSMIRMELDIASASANQGDQDRLTSSVFSICTKVESMPR
jgi:hypothetical protein